MQLFGLKTCDTCRKALKVLDKAEFVDVRSDGVPQAILAQAFEAFGAALVNTKSTTWRGLSDNDRTKAPLELLVAHPTLMKRPLIVRGDEMWLGWGSQTQVDLS